MSDIVTTGGAGWNAGEVTVAVLIEAAASPDGLTQASIINAARNLRFHPTLLREGMNYTMNGEEDAFYSQDVQIGQYNVADGFYTDIGEPYSFELTHRWSSPPQLADGDSRSVVVSGGGRRRPWRSSSLAAAVVVGAAVVEPSSPTAVVAGDESAGIARVRGRADEQPSAGCITRRSASPVISTSNCHWLPSSAVAVHV